MAQGKGWAHTDAGRLRIGGAVGRLFIYKETRRSGLGLLHKICQHRRGNAQRKAAHEQIGNGPDYGNPKPYKAFDQISEEFKHSTTPAGQKALVPLFRGDHFFCNLTEIRNDAVAHPTMKMTPPNITAQDIYSTSQTSGYTGM